MDKNILHVIDKEGQRKVIPFNEEAQHSDDCPLDLEWYLFHGYMTLEQHEAKMKEIIDSQKHARIYPTSPTRPNHLPKILPLATAQ